MGWKLIGLSEPIDGQTIVIDRDMVMGRHQQADIVLQASHISRRHAQLLLREDGRQLWIVDLESSNGTFVNGQQVIEKQLKHLDQINFEAIQFQVLAEADQTQVTHVEKNIPFDEGMSTLEERSADVQVNRDGMPTNINVPKPAPIPEHVVVPNSHETQEIVEQHSENRVQKVEQEQKNAKVGLMSLIVFVILLVLAGIFYLG